ncbi:MAG: hypothetical protein U0807_19155 [Candidatus Binatia bacterium]
MMSGKALSVMTLDLLQHPAAEHVGLRAARERDQQDRVDAGSRQPGGDVHRPRADQVIIRQRAPAGAKMRVGDVRRGLLVARGDHADPVLAILERVEQRHVAVPRDSADVRDALGDQVLRDDLPARHLHRPAPPCLRLDGGPGKSLRAPISAHLHTACNMLHTSVVASK